ncbi:MAG: hypothetical protein M1826_000150 [Phylliscum demangeonii]|nr:MAG: hypothetical protein M1826_000150 [Phylliscum demangeonii]
MVNSRELRAAELGRHIFVYCNIRTNQVVYSLTRTLKNNASLRQLPFVGKKTVPASLRKDLWQPLATITFPHPGRGLNVLHKLREYRKLHELSYPLEDFKGEKNPNGLLEWKKRGRWLMDQKANSIADIAAALTRQEEYATAAAESARAASEKARLAEHDPAERLRAHKQRQKRMQMRARRGTDVTKLDQNTAYASGPGTVMIRWRDILDAEFAEQWPASVVHDGLDYSRHTAPLPVREAPQDAAEPEAESTTG